MRLGRHSSRSEPVDSGGEATARDTALGIPVSGAAGEGAGTFDRAHKTVGANSGVPVDAGAGPRRTPFYPKLLRLRHIHPNAWQRAVLGEGMALAGGVLALADLATAWSVVVLPVAVAVVVKAHDLLAGALAPAITRAVLEPRVDTRRPADV